MTAPVDLFRNEAVAAQNPFNGRTRLAPPLSWTLVNILLCLLVVLAIVFASSVDYARTISAPGTIDTADGAPVIVAEHQGYVDLKVDVGDRVEAGETLAVTRPASRMPEGAIAELRRDASFAEARSADIMADMARAAGRSRSEAREAQAAAAEGRLAALTVQLTQAREQTRRALNDLERAQRVAERGFLSRTELEKRESELAANRQAEAVIAEQIEITRGERDTARSEAAEALQEAEVVAQNAYALALRARRTAIEDSAILEFSHIAPIGGTVASLPFREGALVQPGDTVAILVPQASTRLARISIPAQAMTEIKVGQAIRVAIDAYPYQTFGMLEAEIISVSRASTDGPAGPVFIVEAALPDSIQFYSEAAELLPGMTLEARIATKKRSLLEWLLDPILAVSRR